LEQRLGDPDLEHDQVVLNDLCIAMAGEFSDRQCANIYGLKPWMRWWRSRQLAQITAIQHWRQQLLMTAWQRWKAAYGMTCLPLFDCSLIPFTVVQRDKQKVTIATAFHQLHTQRRALARWRGVLLDFKQHFALASRHHRYFQLRQAMSALQQVLATEREYCAMLERKARQLERK
jgi:hypothetical protein